MEDTDGDEIKPVPFDQIESNAKPIRRENQSVMFPTLVKEHKKGSFSQIDDDDYRSDENVPSGSTIGARIKR